MCNNGELDKMDMEYIFIFAEVAHTTDQVKAINLTFANLPPVLKKLLLLPTKVLLRPLILSPILSTNLSNNLPSMANIAASVPMK